MILPKEDKTVATLTVPEDKLEMVMGKETANKPDSEPPDTAQEIAKLESQLAELEDKQQQNGEKFTERLRSVDTTLAELRGIVKASSLFVQGRGLLARLEELEDDMAKVKEAWQAERESLACPNPECGKLVG